MLSSSLMKRLGVILTLSLEILYFAGKATAQATTDPVEVTALNTILARWDKKAPASTWNTTGDPCSGWAIDDSKDLDNDGKFNPGIKCDCTYNSSQTCHIVKLRVYALDVVGIFPDELQNLTYLNYLKVDQNYLTGHVPAFIGNLTRLKVLSFGINALSGPIPRELGNLQSLTVLGMGTNNFSGSIPEEFGNMTSLQQWYMDSSGLSGELPETLSKLTNMKILWASDNDFTGKIPDYIGSSWTSMTELRFQGNSFEGPIPANLANLVKLTSLRIGDITNGSRSALDFVSNMTSLSTLVSRNCKIDDSLPNNFSKYNQLLKLFLGNNSLTGSLPSVKSSSLLYIDLSYNELSGSFPSWVIQDNNLQLNLVANNFVIDHSTNSNLPPGLNCLQRDIPCYKGNPRYYFFAINCGGANSISAQDHNTYEPDNSSLSAASYYVTDAMNWGVSNVGAFSEASSNNYIIATLSQFQNTLDSELFQTSRMSASSLRYYGIGLENGNYTVKLQFAESAYPNPPPPQWKSTGRRIFDIYIQVHYKPQNYVPLLMRYLITASVLIKSKEEKFTVRQDLSQTECMKCWFPACITLSRLEGNHIYNSISVTAIWAQNCRRGDLKEKDFNIRKEAGRSSFVAVVKVYTVSVTNNFLEIHFFWAGKGTCCVPNQGYYGPAISAISVSSDFIPTVPKKEPGTSKSKTGLIVGVTTAVVFSGLLVVLAVLVWKYKIKKKEINEELLGIVDRPDMFSYADLKSATKIFSPSNILGEGGYGPVYKGILPDGRVVAVKQLAATSHQGRQQFVTEIATISAVQHKNLVKLYGCCIEGNTPLLVYEYLDNRSLDLAIFGNSSLFLDWSTRFEICLGVARGLAYLHEESAVKIIHRDIKASNILLDRNLNPKISDFGLAKLYDDKKSHISTRVAGTIGYLAPEYAMRGHLTEKTDVFAFGVLALEVVAGRLNADSSLQPEQVYLLDWAWNLYEKKHSLELVDPRITSVNEDQVIRLIGVSLLCTQASLGQRPSMSRVVNMLTGDKEVTEVTSRPSYLTDWQFKDLASNNFSTSEFSSNKEAIGTAISYTYSSDALLDSIIQDGR